MGTPAGSENRSALPRLFPGGQAEAHVLSPAQRPIPGNCRAIETSGPEPGDGLDDREIPLWILHMLGLPLDGATLDGIGTENIGLTELRNHAT
jgi:hypothetical protein